MNSRGSPQDLLKHFIKRDGQKADLEHQTWKVKSPFEKGGFQSVIKIPPAPLQERGGGKKPAFPVSLHYQEAG
jgi:hypothetical protein